MSEKPPNVSTFKKKKLKEKYADDDDNLDSNFKCIIQ